jgi:hypothetical protein
LGFQLNPVVQFRSLLAAGKTGWHPILETGSNMPVSEGMNLPAYMNLRIHEIFDF